MNTDAHRLIKKRAMLPIRVHRCSSVVSISLRNRRQWDLQTRPTLLGYPRWRPGEHFPLASGKSVESTFHFPQSQTAEFPRILRGTFHLKPKHFPREILREWKVNYKLECARMGLTSMTGSLEALRSHQETMHHLWKDNTVAWRS